MPTIDLKQQFKITFKFRSSGAQPHEQIKLYISVTPPTTAKNH